MEFKNRFRILKGGLISLVVSTSLYSAPNGGTVVNGTVNISQNGNTTNINQSSQKATINWQSFGIKNGEIVNFNQPNSNSITLNRVIGNEKSIIDGALNANGQVWLINSNGVLFGKNAKVNTAGIVASTKDIANEDFLKGNYNFKGNSTASILNEGEIKSLEKTHATFIANSVINNGKIEVYKGTINLIGASDVTLNLNDNQTVTYKVNKGVLNALVENNNLIVANGGNVYLTTNAKDELLKGVVNNSGIIEANSIDNLKGEVILFAHGGTANISGTIEAKNGFVETSGKDLSVTDGAKIITGHWLIDPENITIEAGGGGIGGESVSAIALQNALLDTEQLTLQADKNIYVNETITYDKNHLILDAGDSIYINKAINLDHVQGSEDGLELKYGANGNYYFGKDGKINYKNSGGTFGTKKGTDIRIWHTIITDINSLININNNKTGNYVLGTGIDLSGVNWTAIGSSSSIFQGTFDGLGHTISNLTINNTGSSYQGLFGYTSNATIKNIGLLNVDIQGNQYVGGLVGWLQDGEIINSYVTGNIQGTRYIGGLVGQNRGTIKNSYVDTSSNNKKVYGTDYVGGLVGYNYGIITNTYSVGKVEGNNQYIGGLVGYNLKNIENSYSTAKVTGTNTVGGLVGKNESIGIISKSYYKGDVEGYYRVGGLAGENAGKIYNTYSMGTVTSNGEYPVGGLVGYNSNIVENSYSTSKVTGQGTDVGGLIGSSTATPTGSYYDKTVNPTLSENGHNTGKTTAELQNIDTFSYFLTPWDIVEDSTLSKGTPILSWQKNRNDYIWLIGTNTGGNSKPTPNKPTNNEIPKVVDNIEQITNSTSIAVNNYIENSFSGENSQNNNLNLNQNSQTLALNDRVGVEIVNGGIKMPESIDNSSNEDENK